MYVIVLYIFPCSPFPCLVPILRSNAKQRWRYPVKKSHKHPAKPSPKPTPPVAPAVVAALEGLAVRCAANLPPLGKPRRVLVCVGQHRQGGKKQLKEI